MRAYERKRTRSTMLFDNDADRQTQAGLCMECGIADGEHGNQKMSKSARHAFPPGYGSAT